MQAIVSIYNTGLLVLGLIILSQGSEYFVEAASRLARAAGVSELIIGLTLVAIGTSLPEIVSSSAAVVVGSADLAFGNILGSCIANLSLVVGLSAIFSPLASNAVILSRDAKIMIFIIIFLGFSVFDPLTPAIISQIEGLILLFLFGVYVLFLYDGRNECESCYQFEVFIDYLIRLRFLTTLRGLTRRPTRSKSSKPNSQNQELNDVSVHQKNTHREFMIIILSGACVIIGAQFVIESAINLSMSWGISEGVIGITVIALGTSLPEIMVSVNSARRGFGRLLIGNVIGSNIVNITLGLGFAVLAVPASLDLLTAGLLVVLSLLVSGIFYFIIRKDWRVTQREGIALIICYIVSQIVSFGILQLGMF